MADQILIDEAKLETDLDYRVQHLREFVGYTEDDAKIIRQTLGNLAKHAQVVVDSIYEHLFRYSSTAKYFIDPRGVINNAFVAKRKETLTNWLVKVGEGKVDGDFARYLVDVGRKHTEKAGEVRMRVPRHYFIALMSVVQTGLATLLYQEIPDKVQYQKAVIAWNKMMMLVLELMFHGWAEKPTAN
jgi:hypothetical protein